MITFRLQSFYNDFYWITSKLTRPPCQVSLLLKLSGRTRNCHVSCSSELWNKCGPGTTHLGQVTTHDLRLTQRLRKRYPRSACDYKNPPSVIMSNPSRGRGGTQGGYPGGPRGSAGGFSGGRGSGTRGGYGGGSRGGVPGDLIFRGPASVDQRLATLDQLVSSFNKLTFNPKRPHRPGFGTLGRSITLRANFFP
ncbi:uncharacterized protein BJ212DRAFT_1571101, partial [Suillus subaureus]